MDVKWERKVGLYYLQVVCLEVPVFPYGVLVPCHYSH